MERTASETEFINQKTRELMVEWCRQAVVGLPTFAVQDQVFVEFAKSKKWINAEGRILSAGWDTAARFLKR
jgi:hypothetical protein